MGQFFFNALSTMPEVDTVWVKGTIAELRLAHLRPLFKSVVRRLGFLDFDHIQFDLIPGPKFPHVMRNEDAFRGAAYYALVNGLVS